MDTKIYSYMKSETMNTISNIDKVLKPDATGIEIIAADKKAAKLPHNIFMVNLALIHLMMTPAVIALEIGISGILIPLSFSLGIMTYTYINSKKDTFMQHPYIQKHWALALKRYRLLLIAYGVTAALIAIGALLSMTSPDPNMQDILRTVFIRIAVMPTLLMVMICFYLESSAINMAGKGL